MNHFDRSAVAKVIEQGSRLADHQQKLSTRFGDMADLVRESSYWSGINGRSVVTAVDVQQALDERIYRTNRAEELTFEFFVDGTIFIETDGEVDWAGQWSVRDGYGRPCLWSAWTHYGTILYGR